MKTKRVFWDLDRVLLKTDALLQWIVEDLAREIGSTPQYVLASIFEVDKGGFTWRKLFAYLRLTDRLWDEKVAAYVRHYDERAWDHMAPGALNTVLALSGGCAQVLVTFGQADFQRRKWNGMRPLHPFITAQHFVEPGKSKGAVLASYDDGLEPFFVDDSTSWLEDAKRHAPHVRRIRATWIVSGDHPGDGRDWDVARSPAEALAIINAPVSD